MLKIELPDVNLHARDSNGRTVLHQAVQNSQVQMTELLLLNGADVNAADDEGKTALLVAVGETKIANQLLPLLIKYGADVNVTDNLGMNVLHHIAAYAPMQYVALARALIKKGVSLEVRASDQSLPIHDAVEENKHGLVKLFLEHGSPIDAQDEDGEFPLYIATDNDDLVGVHILLERGANPNLKLKDTARTALHCACSGMTIKTDIVRQLLNAGADLLAEDSEGKTAFALLEYKNDSIGTRLMMKRLAIIKDRDPTVQLKDERLVEQNSPQLWSFYQDCIENVRRMRVTRFIETCTFYDLLTKCRCEIAVLMRNFKFIENFRKNRTVLAMYVSDVSEAFERAEKLYRCMVKQEEVINEAFNGLVPDVVVRKLVDAMWICCEQKT